MSAPASRGGFAGPSRSGSPGRATSKGEGGSARRWLGSAACRSSHAITTLTCFGARRRMRPQKMLGTPSSLAAAALAGSVSPPAETTRSAGGRSPLLRP